MSSGFRTIYIDQETYERLSGFEVFEPQWKTIAYSDQPSKKFCWKTSVPQEALQNGLFSPSLCEPDIVVELCEKVV